MKHFCLYSILFATFITGNTYAANQYECSAYQITYSATYTGAVDCPLPGGGTYNAIADGTATNCATYVYRCQEVSTGQSSPRQAAVISCGSCPDGYTLTQKTISTVATSCTQTPYYTCIKNTDITVVECTTTDDCENTPWADIATGYQSQGIQICKYNECVQFATAYRCASGYYGTTSNGSSGCTKCPDRTDMFISTDLSSTPSVSNAYISSIAGQNTSIDDCFLIATRTFYDSTGTYTHTSNLCYYDGTSASSPDFGSTDSGSSGGGVDCSSVDGVCTSSGGTAAAIVSNTKTESGGTYCWCNVASKSFFLAYQNTYCSQACDSACSSWITNDTNNVATNLGCN